VVALYPVQERELYIIKEAAPGTPPATVGVPVPFTSLKPSNKPIWMKDESFQGSMGGSYGVYQGPLIAGYDIGGSVFGDTFGHFLYNILGDYTVTGTTASPTATTSGTMAAGLTAIPVVSGGASFTNGMWAELVDTGSPAAPEIVQVGSGSTATSIVLAAGQATRFAHATTMTVNNTTAPYTHSFSLLNGLVGAPYAGQAAQPPTHTITDRTGIPATGLADQYSYSCLSELTITGNAEKLLAWTGKAVCQTRSVPGSAVGTVNVSSVLPYPSWRSAVGVGGVASSGTQVKNTAEWSVTIPRAVKAYNTNDGTQPPFVIARGKQDDIPFKLTFSPSIDDTALTNMLGNVQPQLEFIAGNGLSGANLVSVTIDIGFGAYLAADLNDSSELFGYDVSGNAPHTAASFTCTPFTGPLTGASGGKSATKITLVNAVPSY
jgi:hypothetical protein